MESFSIAKSLTEAKVYNVYLRYFLVLHVHCPNKDVIWLYILMYETFRMYDLNSIYKKKSYLDNRLKGKWFLLGTLEFE